MSYQAAQRIIETYSIEEIDLAILEIENKFLLYCMPPIIIESKTHYSNNIINLFPSIIEYGGILYQMEECLKMLKINKEYRCKN